MTGRFDRWLARLVNRHPILAGNLLTLVVIAFLFLVAALAAPRYR